jgi:phosphate butyryltransferase
MPIDRFEELFRRADSRVDPEPIAVAGADDPTVLRAMNIATARHWARPILVGPEPTIRLVAQSEEIDLSGCVIQHAEGPTIAAEAVALVRSGAASALMKGQIPTPDLMKAVLNSRDGLRTERVICQVVLMEIPRDERRFLLADTGICVAPGIDDRIDILGSAVGLARMLGATKPRVALMAATETVKASMPETVEWAELTRRGRLGEFGDCVVEGPLSFDLAYAALAGARKHLESEVGGAADIMLFPNLLSANLTVKAIMYTADCEFGGMLRGTSAPVVFMSRADSADSRLNSLALTLRILEHERRQVSAHEKEVI